MKKMIYLGLIVGSCFLASCGEASTTNPSVLTTNTPTSVVSTATSEPKLDFVGVTFNSSTITYDGQGHTLKVEGAPDFATITYRDAGPYVNVGSYVITACVSAPNYNDLNLEATLKIVKADLENIVFNSASFEYDGNPKSIYIEGSIPSDASVNYTSDVEGVKNTATEVGVYHVTATVTSPNYNDLVLEATLTITANDEHRYLKVSGDTLFFQNAIDDNEFYVYNFNNENLRKVNSNIAVEMIDNDDNSIMYISESLSSSIKVATYDEDTNNVTVATALNKHANYIQKESDEVIYYAVNSLFNDDSGIYKADLSGNEPVITRLSIGKAKYLKLYGSKLYFADGANNNKLSSISTSGVDQTRYVVVDSKINNLILDNGKLYFTIDNLLGDYIASYNIANGVMRKLTIDAGVDLTIVGDELYYVNVDIFATSVIGNGIYKVKANPSYDSNSTGTRVVDGGELGVCSLTAYEDSLIYYDVNGYKLMNLDLNTDQSYNILESFVKPEDPAPTSFGSQVEESEGIIYYLDIYDEKTLHSYNPKTKMNFKLTSEKVDNFAIIGDYIYYNMVGLLLNNDTYRVNIKVSSVPELVNEYDSAEMVSDGTYLYYVERNLVGSPVAIHKSKLDGSEDVVIFNHDATNLVLDNGNLYFSAKPTLVYTIMVIKNVASVSTPQDKVTVNKDYACDKFAIADGVIYFRHNHGLAYKFHKLAKMNLDGTNYQEIVTQDTDPTEIIVRDGYVYYSCSADLANDFDLYKVSINGNDSSKIRLTEGYYASSLCLVGDSVYFINYYLGGTLGDSRLYSVSINGGTVEKIA